MSAIYPMPRNSLVWLLAAVLLSVVPQAARLPEWMLLVAVGCVFWRVQVFRQRWRFPGKLVRLAFVMLTTWGIFVHYGSLLGPDAGVALLIVAYLFKLLEMYQRRDAYVIVILSYFVLATTYLFDTSLLTTLFTFVVCTAITAALVGLHQVNTHRQPLLTFKLAALMMLQSLPLMIVLFVLVPRVGPIWSLSIGSEKARTGIGEEMTPGDITELSKSPELAFRVEFTGEPPAREQMYWRGIVFSRFNGRTWFIDQSRFLTRLEQADQDYYGVQLDAEPVRYQIMLKATFRDWLFAMPWARIDYPDTYQSEDLTWLTKEGVNANIIYSVESYPNFRFQTQALEADQREHYLRLPTSGNPRTREFAQQLLTSAQGDQRSLIDRLLTWIRQDNFSYTLSPPELSGDTIDGFLFDTQSGFCAHYAGAMVFLLRSAGIPARMIVGYQGGTWHPSGNYLLVHQYDAHAWVEAWLPEQGWVRFDPTAAIAPERIFDGPFLGGIDDSFALDSPLSPQRLRNTALLKKLRDQLDYYDYLWTRWVVGYQQDTQQQFLASLLGQVTPQKLIWVLGGVGAAVVGLLAVLLLLRQRPTQRLHPADRLYLRLCKKLARRGIRREQGEAPGQFAQRVAQTQPELAEVVGQFTELYQDLRYAAPLADTELNPSSHSQGVIMRDSLARMRGLLRQC